MKQTKWNIVYATTIALMFAISAMWVDSIFLSLQQSTHATTTTPSVTPGGQIIDEKKLVELSELVGERAVIVSRTM